MAKRLSIKAQRLAAPKWVFDWRPHQQSSFPKAMILLTMGAGFALFLTSVRIHVEPPTSWATRKASILHLTDDADGRALTLRAREGGPFPSRFEPAEWEESAAIEQSAFQVTRMPSPPYMPVLRNLPTETTPTMALAAKGEATMPPLNPDLLTRPLATTVKLAPVLSPLSGILPTAMPRSLPPFDGMVDAAISAESSRFLLNLDAAGNVLECVSLMGGDETGPPPLVDWLRSVPFSPEPTKPSRWIVVAVTFSNHPAHGPHSR
ncbi:MAG: hypothetical protein RLZZ282_1017 [Verrucomicrobiota bacterium]